MHHGIGHMITGGSQRSTTSPQVRGQPPPPGQRSTSSPPGQRSTPPVRGQPPPSQRLTTSPPGQRSTTPHIRGQPRPPPPRIHTITTVNGRVVRILLECILVII